MSQNRGNGKQNHGMVEIQDLSQEIIEIKAIPEEEVKDNHHYYI